MTEGELGWCAGFFDGEGSIVCLKKNNSVVLKIDSTDLDVLERFQGYYGGSVLPRPVRTCNPKPQWRWSVSRAAVVETLLRSWLPYLSVRRAARAHEALDRVARVRR